MSQPTTPPTPLAAAKPGSPTDAEAHPPATEATPMLQRPPLPHHVPSMRGPAPAARGVPHSGYGSIGGDGGATDALAGGAHGGGGSGYHSDAVAVAALRGPRAAFGPTAAAVAASSARASYHTDDDNATSRRREHQLVQQQLLLAAAARGGTKGSGGRHVAARRAPPGVMYIPRRGSVGTHIGNAVNQSVGRSDLELLHQRDRTSRHPRAPTPPPRGAPTLVGASADGCSPEQQKVQLRASDLVVMARRMAAQDARRTAIGGGSSTYSLDSSLEARELHPSTARDVATPSRDDPCSQSSLTATPHPPHAIGVPSATAGASQEPWAQDAAAINASTVCSDDDQPLDWATAVRDLCYLAAPAAISLMMTYVAGVITVSFVGTMLGHEKLAGASVGLFACNILLYPIIGLTYAVDTLVSQEYGRNPDSDEQGLIAQRGLLLNVIAMFPCCVIIAFRDSILHQFYPPQLAINASEFMRYSPVYIFSLASCAVMAKYLNNQRLPHLVTYSMSTCLVVLPPLLRFMLPAHGLSGAMLAMCIAAAGQLVAIGVLAWWNLQSRGNWGAWRISEALSDVEANIEHLKLALPSSVFVALEACAFDASVLIAGALGEVEGDIWSVVLNILLILVSLPGGFVPAITACVGTAIGEGAPESARKYAIAGVLLAIGVSVANNVVMYWHYDRMIRLFSDHVDIIEGAHRIKWVVIMMHLFDSAQFAFQGIFSGAGRNDQGALILMVSLWCIGIPAAAFSNRLLGLRRENAVAGVVGGLLIGLIVELPILLVVVARWDWEALCEEAAVEEAKAVEEEEERLRVKVERDHSVGLTGTSIDA